MEEADEVAKLVDLLSAYGPDFVPRKHKNRLEYLQEQYIPEFHQELDKVLFSLSLFSLTVCPQLTFLRFLCTTRRASTSRTRCPACTPSWTRR